MIKNYKKWFYNQYKYITGNRDGNITFNDSKWIDIGTRYQNIGLLSQAEYQPYNVISNKYGFDKLVELLSNSNYSFQDIDKSLIATYNNALNYSMGQMLENSGLIVGKYRTYDETVANDINSAYYKFDIPYDLLRFGERDEFIRNRLQYMHTTSNDLYIPITEFVSNHEVHKFLNFSMMITANGLICNDAQVAFDEKGIRVKARWGYSSDCEFLVYKFDTIDTFKLEISFNDIKSGVIPYNKLGIDPLECKCILDIYDPKYSKMINVCGNFGHFDKDGLHVDNIQEWTLNKLYTLESSTVSVIVYAMSNLQEVPNLYPACNYYDLTSNQKVFTESGNRIVSDKHNNVTVSNSTTNGLEVCTPPITLDRDNTNGFKLVINALNLRTRLRLYAPMLKQIGVVISELQEHDSYRYETEVLKPAKTIMSGLSAINKEYIEIGIMTSLVSDALFSKFNSLIESVNGLIRRFDDYREAEGCTFPELYDDNYEKLVDILCTPFETSESYATIRLMGTLTSNFFKIDRNSQRIFRPVSDQNFITLRYDSEMRCFVFVSPNIKHFHGIGNTFYIDDELHGDEVFKFFVSYPDTFNTTLDVVKPFSEDVVYDFDKFCDEVDKFTGYMRWWYTENKILKISSILHEEYSDEKSIDILSKMLKNKLTPDEFLVNYQSHLNYEKSSMTSLNYKGYTDDSAEAPFMVNFLFYAYNMLNGDNDKLQSFFYRNLVNKKFAKDYFDYDITDKMKSSYGMWIDYSGYTLMDAINHWDDDSDFTEGYYYGLPFKINSLGNPSTSNAYLRVFNDFTKANENNSIMCYSVTDTIDKSKFVKMTPPKYIRKTYKDDINLLPMLCQYVCIVEDCINTIQTNYDTSFNILDIIDTYSNDLKNILGDINGYASSHTFTIPNGATEAIIQSLHADAPSANVLILRLEEFRQYLDGNLNVLGLVNFKIAGIRRNIFGVISKFASDLNVIHKNIGFIDEATLRVRKLYKHLKEFNSRLNLYKLKQWFDELDMPLINILGNLLADNENVSSYDRTFTNVYNVLNAYKTNLGSVYTTFDTEITSLLSYMNTTGGLNSVKSYIKDVYENYIFSMYTMDDFSFDNTYSYSSKPYMVEIQISNTSDDDHFKTPLEESGQSNISLILKPNWTKTTASSFKIQSLSRFVEYTFFDGTPITGATMLVYGENGTLLNTDTVDITFTKVSSSISNIPSIFQINYIETGLLDFLNNPEDFKVVNNKVAPERRSKDNYELYVSNKYIQLESYEETMYTPRTGEPKLVDRVRVSNSLLNRLRNEEIGYHVRNAFYFKPVQIQHLLPDSDGVITSIGGKYYEGQILYVKTDDTGFVFPIKVTKIDHNEAHGLIEAEPVCEDWFEVLDNETIEDYISSPIACTILPDNVCNFIDEYTNGNSESFTMISYPEKMDFTSERIENAWELPGDPMYVTLNADYVYMRLNQIFNDIVPNGNIPYEYEQYRFNYIASCKVLPDDTITIDILNHNRNNMSVDERYPVFRTEPNDHGVWDEEQRVFNEMVQSLAGPIKEQENLLKDLQSQIYSATSKYVAKQLNCDLMVEKAKYENMLALERRLGQYIEQPETPTTWHNIYSYESSLVYISNGRVFDNRPINVINDIRDIIYTDKLDVFIYDWENHVWLDPNTYTVLVEMIDGACDESANYLTEDIMHHVVISFNDSTYESKRLYVYFAWKKSDIYDSIDVHDTSINVLFKPMVSLYSKSIDYDVTVRKNIDNCEKYTFTEYNSPDYLPNGFSVKRYRDASNPSTHFRICDMTLMNGVHSRDFMVYIKHGFLDTELRSGAVYQSFTATISKPIDSFINDKKIKLICVQNNSSGSYDGNISSIMFEGYTENNGIVITKSNLPNSAHGSFVCTVLQSNDYIMSGGLVTVNVNTTSATVTSGDYVAITDIYRELPDEFVVIPETCDLTNGVTITLENKYVKSTSMTLTRKPYEFYFDSVENIRYPFSNVRGDDSKTRLDIDQTLNTNVSVCKPNHISVCRYSCHKINPDGVVNLLGYIPTPLSYDRYEFWMNGRYLNKKHVDILSPTSIHVHDVVSLKNFEVLELVDDYYDSPVTITGNVYVDLNGKMFSSYIKALKSNVDMDTQSVSFTFNVNNHRDIDDYQLKESNNIDNEPDILDNIISDEEITDYDQLYNIPTLNGYQIRHLTAYKFMREIPISTIANVLDDIWKPEQLENPDFPVTHRYAASKDEVSIIVKRSPAYKIRLMGLSKKSFSVFITNNSNDSISDTTNCVKIIPFVKTGYDIIIDSSYAGKWVHTTNNAIPVKL